MILTLSPIRADAALSLQRKGDILTVNGEAFDFSDIPEGATLPRAAVACDWLASDITRTDGVLALTLALPHGANAPVETRFATPITLTADGPVTLPSYDLEGEEQ